MTELIQIPQEELKIKELIAKLREIQQGLKQNLANLHEKIEILDSEPDLSKQPRKLQE